MDACEITTGTGFVSRRNLVRLELNERTECRHVKKGQRVISHDTRAGRPGRVGEVRRFVEFDAVMYADVEYKAGRLQWLR